MSKDFTIVIPTHNRHKYLSRILTYYSDFPFNILIGDSSKLQFTQNKLPINALYFHLPDMELPQKITMLLNKVITKFVVICADDDFIIPDSIEKCVKFLTNNKQFASAGGNYLTYSKDSAIKNDILLSAANKNKFVFEVSSNEPLQRLEQLFTCYRSMFYAVHYTKNLQIAFKGTLGIHNLYLNEYLSAIPITIGKFIELPIFYQVREFSSTSDDKIIDNLDTIVESIKYQQEYQNYLEFYASVISNVTGNPKPIALIKIRNIFNSFSIYLKNSERSKAKIPFTKRLGKFLLIIPFFGRVIIKIHRDRKRKKEVALIIRNDKDQTNLDRIKKLVLEYGRTISE